MADDRLDLSRLNQVLTPIFEAYPAGNLCDLCAQAVSDALRNADYIAAIVTIQNESIPGQPDRRPPFIQAYDVEKRPFLLGQTGFHQAVRVSIGDTSFYMDALVYIHYGLEAVDETTYWSLFWYPDSVEITDVQEV